MFRVARQFLTTACDVIRRCNGLNWKFFFPRKNRALAQRLLIDLQFWRRFVSNSPQSSFDFLLGRLPLNEDHLFSDASSSYGMGGVFMFAKFNKRKFKIDGLFWQLSWEGWRRQAANNKVCPGAAGINTAEFLAALITCETFAPYCSERITELAIDNFTAKSWLDRARCTRFPSDLCAQGVHSYMLEQNMTIRTRWFVRRQWDCGRVIEKTVPHIHRCLQC